MKSQTNNIVRSLAAIVFCLTLFVCGAASQTQRSKQRSWDWKKHRIETINYAKRYPVSAIEPDLPRQSFAQWFRKIVGQPAKISWQINDCGEQTGTAEGKGRDLPMCVNAVADLGTDVSVSVNIQFGTFKRGITRGRPAIRSITISREDDFGVQPEKLSELAGRLSELLTK